MKSVIRGQIGNYRLQYDLGRGQQGTVFCGENLQSGEHFAIKIVRFNHIPTRESIEKEVTIHKMMSHRNIIKCVESL